MSDDVDLDGLSFGVRMAGDITIIDWSMRGGDGCMPASATEVELIEYARNARSAALEEAAKMVAEWPAFAPMLGEHCESIAAAIRKLNT